MVIIGSACKGDRQVAVVPLPYYHAADLTPYWPEGNIDTFHQVADFQFIDQYSDTVTKADIQGKIAVVNFFFTVCPSVCPKMTNNLLRVQSEYGNDPGVVILSHTVMPWMDSVAALQEYARIRGVESANWHLLTGPKEEIYRMGRQSYFADEGFGKEVTSMTDFLHTENIMLVDKKLHLRGVYNGTVPLEMSRMIEDIRKLKGEG